MEQRRARGMLAAAAVIFGTLAPFVRGISVSSGELALYRAVMAALLVGGYLLVSGQKLALRAHPREAALLLLSGTAMGVNWILLFEAYRYTTVSVATLSYYFAPVLVTAACPLLFHERLTGKQIVCFVMSTLGLVLVIGVGGLRGGADVRGVLFGLGAAAFYAAVILLNKFIRSVAGIQRTFLQFLAAIVILIPYVAVTGGVLSVLVFAKDLLVGIVVSVYILARKETFGLHTRKLLYSLVSAPHYERALRATREADRIFSGFVRGKLLDSLIIGILCFIVCSILKFPYTPIIAVFVGVTNIIPIFGPFLGAIPSAFLILLVSPRQCLYFIIFIIALQQFDGNILGPKILGETVGISSFWIVVAILVGGGFGGVLGMFLGVPVFACIHSAVSFLCESSLRKKGVTDDTIFAPRRVLTGTTTTPKGENHE